MTLTMSVRAGPQEPAAAVLRGAQPGRGGPPGEAAAV